MGASQPPFLRDNPFELSQTTTPYKEEFMATKPQTKEPVRVEPIDDSGLSKYTWNVRGFNESLTIRTYDVEELKAERDKWKAVISPPRRKLPYLHSGDKCPIEGCTGVMVTRTATNRRTQQAYNFLRCSKSPDCKGVAYIETEENTPEENGAAVEASA
jgi:hypothetical protein